MKEFSECFASNEKAASSSEMVVQLSSNIVKTNPADSYTRYDVKHIDEILEFTKPTNCVLVAKVIKIEHEN